MKNFIRCILVILIVVGFHHNNYAQKVDTKLLHGIKARSIGPAGMSGRVTSIDVALSDPDKIYIGTASGGVWYSSSGGIEWEPIFDDQPLANIGAVAVDQERPGIIWVGTGEGNPRNSQSSGNGIYKSIDGGKSWKHLGLENTRTIHRIVINPDNPDIVYIAAQGSAWGENAERGIFKTTDGGESWDKILFVNEKTGAADLVMDPENPEKLIAAMWEYRRWPWFFKSGGPGSGIYITFDGGKTWDKRTEKNGLPKGELGRIGLAISKSSPNVVYAIVESKKNALFRSDDGGFNWRKTSDKNIGNRPFYYADIFVDPSNENRIYSLFSVVNKSEDGGKTFERFLGWNIHPDHHAWWVHPDDPDFMIDGNDGGLSLTRDKGKTWKFIENLPLAQFYHINYDMDFAYHVYGGMQDNGSWRGPSKVFRRGGLRNAYWEELGFGDGFDVVPYPKNSRFGYAMSQGGSLYRYDNETGNNLSIRPLSADTTALRFNWNAAIAQDPFDSETIYYGSQFIHKSTDMGISWRTISPDLTTNDPEKQKQAESGGLTYDVTDAENYTTIISIAPSPLKKGVIWVGADDGKVQLTKNGGESWLDLTSNIDGAPDGGWIPQIRPSTYDSAGAFVVINNYRKDDWAPYVFQTNDFGENWERIIDENDLDFYALSFIQDPVEPNLYFVGSESGLYFSIDGAKNWTKWTRGFPTVSTMDLQIHPRENDLIIGTFGRAAYIIDDIRPLRELAKNGLKEFDAPLKIYPVRDAYQMSYLQPKGSRFSAGSEFDGENLPYGAMISFEANPDTSKQKEEDHSGSTINDSVKVEIVNSDGEVIRTILKSPKKGITRFYWRLDQKGIRFPSSQKPKKNSPEWGGRSVIPGSYLVRISHGIFKDSTTVNVKSDPRINVDLSNLIERDKMIQQLEPEIEKITKAADQLRDIKKSLELISGRLKNKSDSTSKELSKFGKEIKDSVGVLWDILFQKEGKQGITSYDEKKLNARLRNAYWTIGGSNEKPGQREKIVLDFADKGMSEFIPKFNNFIGTVWTKYRKAIEDARISFFDDFEHIE